MANYYTNFSFSVTLVNPGQRDAALTWFRQLSAIQQGEEVPAGFPENLREAGEDDSFEAEAEGPNGLWLHSSSGGIDAVCAFVQHLLQQFQPTAIVTFEWSHDCSQPRTDAYGGGAALITAKEIKTFNTAEWLRQQTETLNPG